MQLFPYLISQKLICVKISGQAFSGRGEVFDNTYIARLAKAFKELEATELTHDIKFVVVVGAGNIWRGKRGLNLINADQADYMGMIATNLNAIYLREMLSIEGVSALILSSLAIENVVDKFSINRARAILKENRILIISSGTGKPGVTTDSATELYARKLGIKTVIIGKNNVNSIYNSDPAIDEHATKIKEITFRKLYENKIQIIDLKATKRYINSHVCAVIININNPQNLVKLFMQKTNNYSIITDN